MPSLTLNRLPVTFDTLSDVTRTVAAERPDFVDSGGSYYFDAYGAPLCILGHVIDRIGSRSVIASPNANGLPFHHILPVLTSLPSHRIPDYVYEWFGQVQSLNDHGVSWRRCIFLADRYVFNTNFINPHYTHGPL